MKDWLRVAARKDVVLRGVKVAVLVGTVLVAINQGDVLLSGRWSGPVLAKIVLTYAVPYCVSTYASVAAIRAQRPC